MFSMNDFDLHRLRQRELMREAQRQRLANNWLKNRKSQRDPAHTDAPRRTDLRRALARITALFF
jgi:hypothetical protein